MIATSPRSQPGERASPSGQGRRRAWQWGGLPVGQSEIPASSPAPRFPPRRPPGRRVGSPLPGLARGRAGASGPGRLVPSPAGSDNEATPCRRASRRTRRSRPAPSREGWPRRPRPRPPEGRRPRLEDDSMAPGGALSSGPRSTVRYGALARFESLLKTNRLGKPSRVNFSPWRVHSVPVSSNRKKPSLRPATLKATMDGSTGMDCQPSASGFDASAIRQAVPPWPRITEQRSEPGTVQGTSGCRLWLWVELPGWGS